MPVVLKRVYEKPAAKDGTRVLVDRLWPRGLSKDTAAVDVWMRDLAPSDELRQWYHAYPQHWVAFQKQYLKELSNPKAAEPLAELYRLVGEKKTLTLLYASRNEERNNATVLKLLLDGMRKPPTGTGSAAGRAIRRRAVRQIRG